VASGNFAIVAPTVPSVQTNAATSVTNITAILNGAVNANGFSRVVTFEYGTSTSYGSSVTASQSPIGGSSSIGVSAPASGLTSGQIYHFRVRAICGLSEYHGADMTFTTTVKDYDGNIYNTVIIGTQVWMKENLKTMKYNDGTSIPNVTDNATWAALATPAYCWYKNDATSYKATYGALYNWYTVHTGKLCPAGWHVPSDAEWTILSDYLGGLPVAGGKLKESGTVHWASPNTGATNESGFTALAGGVRANGVYTDMLTQTWWWASTETNSFPWIRAILNYLSNLGNSLVSPVNGASVRCLRN